MSVQLLEHNPVTATALMLLFKFRSGGAVRFEVAASSDGRWEG